jgi:hypothetical protein
MLLPSDLQDAIPGCVDVLFFPIPLDPFGSSTQNRESMFFFLQRKIFEESDFRGHGTWRGTVSRTASVVVSRLRWEGRVQRFGLALCGRHIIAV